MTKSINKQYKFVYMRDDRYDRSFDGADFSDMRAKYPKFIVGNKKPTDSWYYGKGIRANEFMGLYLDDYSQYSKLKSFNEAEWTKLIHKYCKQQVSKLKKELKDVDLRNSINANTGSSYYAQVREMLIPIYKAEAKLWKDREQVLRDNGAYTYLELTK